MKIPIQNKTALTNYSKWNFGEKVIWGTLIWTKNLRLKKLVLKDSFAQYKDFGEFGNHVKKGFATTQNDFKRF